MLVIFKFQCSIIHNKTTWEGARRMLIRMKKKKHAARTPNATCHRPGASTPSNLNRRMKPNAKNGTQKWNQNCAFHENVPWRFIFMLSSIFDLIFDSFSIENWNENWNENWPKILTVSIPIYVFSDTGDFQDPSSEESVYNSYKTPVHSHASVCRLSRKINSEQPRGIERYRINWSQALCINCREK